MAWLQTGVFVQILEGINKPQKNLEKRLKSSGNFYNCARFRFGEQIMRTETFRNPDVELAISPWDVPLFPQFSHMETVHHESLQHSDNSIINNLIAAGYDIHPADTTFFFGFQGIGFKLERHFPAVTREEFQIEFGDGYLRFRFSEPATVYLTLFSILPDRRGKGLARLHFPKLIDGLFRAGVNLVHGEVASPYCEPRNALKPNKLIHFYVRHAGFLHHGGRKISKRSPYLEDARKTVHASPKKRAIGTRKQSEMAMIS